MPKSLQIALYVSASIYTIGSVVGLLGALGAICKRTGLIRTYFLVLVGTFIVQTASSVYYLIAFFKMRGASQEHCLKETPKHAFMNTAHFCESIDQLKQVHPAGVVASALIPLLIIACAYSFLSSCFNTP